MITETETHALFLRIDPDYDRNATAALVDFAIDSLSDNIRSARAAEADAFDGYAVGRRHGLETGLVYMQEVRKLLAAFSEARAEMAAEMVAK